MTISSIPPKPPLDIALARGTYSWFKQVWTWVQRITFPQVSQTANFTASNAYFYPIDCTAGAITATLPAANTCLGKQYCLKKVDATANGAVTITPTGSDVIDGAATKTLTNRYDQMVLISDGVSNWWIVTQASGGTVSQSKGQEFTTAGSSNFTAGFAGVYLITLSGAGAAGGGKAAGANTGAGGGGAGEFKCRYPVYLTNGQVVSVTIGAKGTCTAGANNGADGGATSFGTICTVAGGLGGKTAGAGGNGGGPQGATGGVAASPGNPGSKSVQEGALTWGGSSGGSGSTGAAGAGGAGGSEEEFSGGAAGASSGGVHGGGGGGGAGFKGAGGAGGSNGNGTNAAAGAYGAGGGGASGAAGATAGGSGMDGYCLVEYVG